MGLRMSHQIGQVLIFEFVPEVFLAHSAHVAKNVECYTRAVIATVVQCTEGVVVVYNVQRRTWPKNDGNRTFVNCVLRITGRGEAVFDLSCDPGITHLWLGCCGE
eukprot:scaffold11522_cov239-Ochromonas_danica.AAC.6